jgi:hypothetical protein
MLMRSLALLALTFATTDCITDLFRLMNLLINLFLIQVIKVAPFLGILNFI